MTSLLIAATLIHQLPSPQRYYLLVGVGKYKSYDEPYYRSPLDLFGPSNDVIETKRRLDSLGWKPLPGTKGIYYSGITTSTDEIPTKDVIERSLDEASKLSAEDSFLFMFSGHGATVGDDEVIIPFDGRTSYSDRAWKLELKSTVSLNVDVKPRFDKIKVKDRAIVLNMCREKLEGSQTMSSSDYGSRLMSVFTPGSKTVPLIVYSTSPGKFAYDGQKDTECTVFGSAFKDELENPDNCVNGQLSLARAIQLTCSKVVAETSKGLPKYEYGPMNPDYIIRSPADLFLIGKLTEPKLKGNRETSKFLEEIESFGFEPKFLNGELLVRTENVNIGSVEATDNRAIKAAYSYSDQIYHRVKADSTKKYRIYFQEFSPKVEKWRSVPENVKIRIGPSNQNWRVINSDSLIDSSYFADSDSSSTVGITEVFGSVLDSDGREWDLIPGQQELNQGKGPSAVRLTFAYGPSEERNWICVILVEIS